MFALLSSLVQLRPHAAVMAVAGTPDVNITETPASAAEGGYR
jgi:hypothetical protein